MSWISVSHLPSYMIVDVIIIVSFETFQMWQFIISNYSWLKMINEFTLWFVTRNVNNTMNPFDRDHNRSQPPDYPPCRGTDKWSFFWRPLLIVPLPQLLVCSSNILRVHLPPHFCSTSLWYATHFKSSLSTTSCHGKMPVTGLALEEIQVYCCHLIKLG